MTVHEGAARRAPGPVGDVAGSLARTMAAGLIGGALCGAVVGGVLGRLAMRLLAATSPSSARFGITDDQAVVGDVSVAGSLSLLIFTAGTGAVVGLVYLWVSRVLPAARRGRILGFGLVRLRRGALT